MARRASKKLDPGQELEESMKGVDLSAVKPLPGDVPQSWDDDADDDSRLQDKTMHTSMHAATDAEHHREAMHPEPENHEWVRAATLITPPARPGYAQRWVYAPRDPNNTNYQRKFAEGWRPRDPKDIPASHRVYRSEKTEDGDAVYRSANLILCEIPIQINESRKKHMANLASRAATGSIAGAVSEGQRQAARTDGFSGLQADIREGKPIMGGGRRPPTMTEQQ